MSMIASIKEIWTAMAIQVSMFREVGRNVMVVGFSISTIGILNLNYSLIRSTCKMSSFELESCRNQTWGTYWSISLELWMEQAISKENLTIFQCTNGNPIEVKMLPWERQSSFTWKSVGSERRMLNLSEISNSFVI